MAQNVQRQWRVVPAVHDYGEITIVAIGPDTVVLDSHFGDYAIWNNDGIVRAVLEARRTPIHRDNLAFNSSLQKDLIPESV